MTKKIGQNPSKPFKILQFCMGFMILCDLEAILLRFCLY